MRLDKLQLLRYGKFTDYTLDFGQYKIDTPDLHIVYGPNEAGKTTLMSAYLDLLFGFPTSTPYNFIHANNALKVGGVLTIADKTVEYRRLKKLKNSLVDANDQPSEDSLLLQQLAGLSRTSYQNMFSLNDKTLEKGGESILASEGDLGKLLYSATTGVAQLSDTLFQMRAESELFYSKTKRKFELAELKKQLKQIDSDRKSIDVEANAYAKLAKLRSEAEINYNCLGIERDKLKLAIQKLSARKSAFPRLKSLHRLQQAMLPLSTLPDTPTDWIDEVKKLQVDSIKADTMNADLAKNIASIHDAISAITPDDAALAANQLWQQIDQVRQSYLIANNNLPETKQQLRLCKVDIEGHLHKLGKTDIENPHSLILDSATQLGIKELIQQHPTLLSQFDAAKKELQAAQKQHIENQDLFLQRGGSTDKTMSAIDISSDEAALDELELCVAPFSNNELATEFRTTLHKRDTALAQLNAIISKLQPWLGDAKILPDLTVPHPSDLQTLRRTRDDIMERTNQEQNSLTALKKKKIDLLAQHKSYTKTGLVDDAESYQLRAQREAAWEKHRKILDTSSADVFEHAMRADDASQTTRLQHTESVAKLGQISRDIIETNEHFAHCQKNLESLSEEQNSFASAVTELVHNISTSLNPTMSIEAVTTWVDNHAIAVNTLHQLNGYEQDLKTIETQASKANRNILKNLNQAGNFEHTNTKHEHEVDKLTDTLALAHKTIRQHRSLTGLRNQLLTSQQQLASRERELNNSQAGIEQWTLAWQTICNDCWLGNELSCPSAVIAEEYLLQLAPLEKQLVLQAKLEEKISQQQIDIKHYRQLLVSLANQLSMATDKLSVNDLYQTLFTRMEKATSIQDSLTTLQAQHDELLKQQANNQSKQALIKTAIATKCTFFSVQSIDEVQLKLQDVARKQELQQRIVTEQNELLDLLEMTSLTDATEAFIDFDSDQAQLELDELERSAADQDMALREAHTARQDARRAVENVGGDDAVARLHEQRANLLLEIEDKTTHFLQQHLALNAADAALKVYRDKHRSSMMSKASDAFAHISQGRFVRLETFQDGGSEQLIAIEKDQGSKTSDKLSKGTRFQLYLALRIAGYLEYTNSRPTVPFIADDILETSDDARSKQIFEALGEMASVGQVIYLTHHQHLCDIAKQAVPDCKIHTLP